MAYGGPVQSGPCLFHLIPPAPYWLALVTVTFFQYPEHTKIFLTSWSLHMVAYSVSNTCPLVVLFLTWLAFSHPSSLALNVTSSERPFLVTLYTSIFLYLCTLRASIMVLITTYSYFHLFFTCSVVCLPHWIAHSMMQEPQLQCTPLEPQHLA